jgi:transposase-like protein
MSTQRRAGQPKSEILAKLPLACTDERAAVEFFEEHRWGSAPNCPRCGDTDVSMMRGKDGMRNRRYLWRCRGCKQQYTVKIGTIMEDSPIPLRHWAYAFYEACKSKKGVSAKEIERQCNVTYKTALFMLHRIRWAMAPANANEPKLGGDGGVVEFDETYVGGKPRGAPNWALSSHREGRAKPGPRPDFKDRKTPVVAGVERGGRVKAHVVDNLTPETLSAHVRNMVHTSATLNTDERPSYKTVGREYAAHNTVRHNKAQWADGDSYTNTIEGFFALLKRKLMATHHSVSRKHLHRYVSEAEFLYNTRSLNDGERTVLAIQSADNRRLTYKQQTGKE